MNYRPVYYDRYVVTRKKENRTPQGLVAFPSAGLVESFQPFLHVGTGEESIVIFVPSLGEQKLVRL